MTVSVGVVTLGTSEGFFERRSYVPEKSDYECVHDTIYIEYTGIYILYNMNVPRYASMYNIMYRYMHV